MTKSNVQIGEEVTFYPKDGSSSLRARVAAEAPNGWWDLDVNNTSTEDGTPHRYFSTRSRPISDFDTDKRGLFAQDVFMTTAL